MTRGLTKTVTIGDKDVTVRELSVQEVRNLIRRVEQGEPTAMDLQLADALGDFLFPDVRVRDMLEMTNATADDLEAMFPSELRELGDACKEVNSHFFEMVARLTPLVELVDQDLPRAVQQIVSQTSNEPSRH